MTSDDVSRGLTGILHTTVAELVRSDGRDLSMRQLGVFLTCYLEVEAQTVRGLAAKLGIHKPAVTRALDRLEEFDLTRRKPDPRDRRSVLIQRTATGMKFLRELRQILNHAATAAGISVAPERSRQATGDMAAHPAESA
jgi:DNA-binding MarR family transcriptional regulator